MFLHNTKRDDSVCGLWLLAGNSAGRESESESKRDRERERALQKNVHSFSFQPILHI